MPARPRLPRSARGLPAAVLLMLASPPAATRAAADPADSAVRQVVQDIISFTRWPAPRPELQLCVVGQPAYAARFFAPWDGTVPIQVERVGTADERLATLCDVVYAGPLPAPEREALGRRIAGRPVLTIGEPDPACIEATMFCLQVAGDRVSFASNLDAIARSGVRLNPRVLLLGRRGGGQPR